ncbi:MAG: hypothetical protein Q4G64_00725, partial [bacterium]|nr:hypothetical protein [bacterium]
RQDDFGRERDLGAEGDLGRGATDELGADRELARDPDHDPGLKQDHDSLKAGAEGGVLDRDWQDTDGDGKHFERVDHEHDPDRGGLGGDLGQGRDGALGGERSREFREGREGGEELPTDLEEGLQGQEHNRAEEMFAGTRQQGRLRRYERGGASQDVQLEGDQFQEEQVLGTNEDPDADLRR